MNVEFNPNSNKNVNDVFTLVLRLSELKYRNKQLKTL